MIMSGFNQSERKIYWRGYHAMQDAYCAYGDASEAYSDINQSNASNTYVRGAQLAYRRILAKQREV